MDRRQKHIEEAHLLVSRLERLSADSYWAHKASGLRGSLIKRLEEIEKYLPEISAEDLNKLNELSLRGYTILELAAREIPDSK